MKLTKDKIEVLETRYVTFTDEIEFRKTDTDLTISGYAITFGSLSENLGGFREVIDRRALDDVDFSDVYLLSQHRSEDVLASTAANTMNVQVTDKGLYFSATLANTTLGRDTYELVKRGDLKSMSFAFTTEEDQWNVKTNPQTRTVKKIGKISELSIVTNPAYKTSSVTKRMVNKCTDLKKCLQKEPNPLLNEAKEILSKIQK
jgi:HK97 family phage prohead protease